MLLDSESLEILVTIASRGIGQWISPQAISQETGIKPLRADYLAKQLAKAGYVKSDSDGDYWLIEKGQAFLVENNLA